jgi:hypothetical protein
MFPSISSAAIGDRISQLRRATGCRLDAPLLFLLLLVLLRLRLRRFGSKGERERARERACLAGSLWHRSVGPSGPGRVEVQNTTCTSRERLTESGSEGKVSWAGTKVRACIVHMCLLVLTSTPRPVSDLLIVKGRMQQVLFIRQMEKCFKTYRF